jgi:uncharacterized SAM-binding protein YcdF (DUF218 family)
LAVTVVCLWRRRRETKRFLWLVTVPASILLLFSIPAVNHLLVGSLEWQYPPAGERPPDCGAIVVLDAGVRFPDAGRPEAEPDLDSMRRCVHAARVYHQGPRCPVVVTGGTADVGGSGQVAAEVLADFLVRLGVKPSDLILEKRSRSTYENAVECRRVLEQRGIRRVVLVTDATHLCRAVRCFRRQGVEVLPSGCWYQASEFRWEAGSFLPHPAAAESSRAVFHEWAGLGWYWLRGRI